MKTQQLVPNFVEVRQGQTWVGGPTHKLQRQHIPGYQGFVKAIEAENLHGKSFAKVTSESINQRNFAGYKYTPEELYKTNYQEEFQKPYLRNAPLTNAAEEILKQRKNEEEVFKRTVIENYQKAPKSINDIPPIDRVPIIGYQGYRSAYRHPLKKVDPPVEPQFQQTGFEQLSKDEQIQLIEKEIKNNRLDKRQPPVVGYTGFQQQIYSENLYGKTFMDLSKKTLNSF